MKNKIFVILAGFLSFLMACSGNSDYSPKPKGYFRIVYPEKNYTHFAANAPFSFDYPVYANVLTDSDSRALPYWYNLSFPQFNGRLHLTYYTIASIKEYDMMVEDARRLAFKHTVKASAIDQKRISFPDHKVYGIYYEIDGNTASSIQFFLTDSTKHYFRGALYFNERPQYDSIAPVIDFIKKDIDRMISSFRWVEPGTNAGKITKDRVQVTRISEKGGITARSGYILPVSRIRRDSLTTEATQFFKLFMNGRLEEAYAYCSDIFRKNLSLAQMGSIRQSFLMSYGTFKLVNEAKQLQQGGYDVVVLNTSFEIANPVFTLAFDSDGKLMGFFNPVQNLIALYKDPAYSDTSKFEERPIIVQTGAIKLPGIITVPKNETNFPIVVLVHGSGAGNRDEGFGGNKTFRDLALGLAAKGIATLRYDKRSLVAPGSFTKTFTVREETEDDALSAIAQARNYLGVDKDQVYALGHSLGAMLMPRIAMRDGGLKGIILAAGPARPFQDISIEQNELNFKQQGGTDANRAGLDSVIAMLNSTRFKTLGNIKPDSATVYGPAVYIMDLNNYNQLKTIKQFKGKILILQGEKDFQVSMKDFELWKSALANDKKANFITYSTLGHPFVEAGPTNTIKDYYKPQNVPIAVINDIANFIFKK